MSPLPVPMDTSPCSSCSGARCCFTYRVAITPSDVHRLCRGTGASPLAFAFLLPREDGGDGIRLKRRGRGHELCLQKRKVASGDNPCIWLTGAEGSYRCGVHPHRPMTCRSFPLRPLATGGWKPLGDPCPPGAWTDGHVRQDGARRLHGLWAVERDLGAAFVERWNVVADQAVPGRSLTRRMFFYWVIAVFDRLSLVLAPWMESDEGIDALLEGWSEHGLYDIKAPWAPAVRAALGMLDGAGRR